MFGSMVAMGEIVGSWNATTSSEYGAYSLKGTAMSSDGSTIASIRAEGSPLDVVVNVYTRGAGNTWSFDSSFTPTMTGTTYLKLDISGDGTRIVVGDYTANSSNGRVEVWHKEGGSPAWTNKLNVDGVSSYGYGHAVTISDDGDWIAFLRSTSVPVTIAFVYEWSGSPASWSSHSSFVVGCNGSPCTMSQQDWNLYSHIDLGENANRLLISSWDGSEESTVEIQDRSGTSWTQTYLDGVSGLINPNRQRQSTKLSRDGNWFVTGSRLGTSNIELFYYDETGSPDTGWTSGVTWTESGYIPFSVDIIESTLFPNECYVVFEDGSGDLVLKRYNKNTDTDIEVASDASITGGDYTFGISEEGAFVGTLKSVYGRGEI